MEHKSLIDSSFSVETPEGVELRLRIGGCGIRAGAWIVDSLIHGGVIFVLAITLTIFDLMSKELVNALLLLTWFLLTCFYPILFEVYKNGQTPGKKAMGIRTVHSDGTPIGWQSSIIRNFLRFADFLPSFYLIGILSVFMDNKSRRLGDLAASTLVVFVDENKRNYKQSSVQAEMLPIQLEVSEKKAIVAFAERQKLLSNSRQEELAEILTPVHGKKKQDAVKKIQAYASSLVGDS
jgi:uncharacterized RDD family membrane protein YckC